MESHRQYLSFRLWEEVRFTETGSPALPLMDAHLGWPGNAGWLFLSPGLCNPMTFLVSVFEDVHVA